MRPTRSLTTRTELLAPPPFNSGPRPGKWWQGALRPAADRVSDTDTHLRVGNKLVLGALSSTKEVEGAHDGNTRTEIVPGYFKVQANQAITERYEFDAQNRLETISRDDIKRTSNVNFNILNYGQGHITVPEVEPGARSFILERRRYNAHGQVLEVAPEEALDVYTLEQMYGLDPNGNANAGLGDDMVRTQYEPHRELWSVSGLSQLHGMVC